MRRIGNSKEPTPEILKKIADNLTKKTGLYSSISVKSTSIAYSNEQRTTKVRYEIYSESFKAGTESYNTWPKVIARYRELMND